MDLGGMTRTNARQRDYSSIIYMESTELRGCRIAIPIMSGNWPSNYQHSLPHSESPWFMPTQPCSTVYKPLGLQTCNLSSILSLLWTTRTTRTTRRLPELAYSVHIDLTQLPKHHTSTCDCLPDIVSNFLIDQNSNRYSVQTTETYWHHC